MKDFVYGLGRKAMRLFYPNHYVRPVTSYLNTLKLYDMVGVEIGTSYGENAKSMLTNLDIYKLYLVDPYMTYSGYETAEPHATDDVMFLKAKNNLEPFESKVVFIRKMSEDAVQDIPDNVDFVYIDGNHAYEYVKKDIMLYFPKVRKGGVIGGHDFCASFPGVARAVLEFVDLNGLELQGLERDWWIQK
jgi:hypothetical protein